MPGVHIGSIGSEIEQFYWVHCVFQRFCFFCCFQRIFALQRKHVELTCHISFESTWDELSCEANSFWYVSICDTIKHTCNTSRAFVLWTTNGLNKTVRSRVFSQLYWRPAYNSKARRTAHRLNMFWTPMLLFFWIFEWAFPNSNLKLVTKFSHQGSHPCQKITDMVPPYFLVLFRLHHLESQAQSI